MAKQSVAQQIKSSPKAARASTAQTEPFYKGNAVYNVAPNSDPVDLLEDAGDFLSAAAATLGGLLERIDNAQIYGAWYLLQMADHATQAALVGVVEIKERAAQ